MNNCLCCGEDCLADEAYCPFCDELHDVIERADNIAERGPRNAKEEQQVAMGYRAYDKLQERSGAFREVDLGDGNRWNRLGEAA